jgi:predicted double-glycine peptidase
MKIFPLLFLLILTFGCATRNIKYDRNKILKKYSTDYETFLDNQKIDLETVYLDKDNIENIRIDRKTKKLKITQFKHAEFFSMENWNLDSISANRRGWDKKNIGMIIIDGILLTDSLKGKIRIDPNSIKLFEIVSKEKLNENTFCGSYDGDIILILTK